MNFIFLFLASFWWHAVYIGVIEIVPREHSDNLEMRIKLFTDDLEEAIRDETGQGILIRDQEALNQFKDLIRVYIENHLSVAINGEPTDFVLLKIEPENDTTWSYFLIDKPGSIQSVTINSDLLLHVFPDQTNVIHLELQDDVKLTRLFGSKTEAEIVFE